MRFPTMPPQRKAHSGRRCAWTALPLLIVATPALLAAQLPVVHGRIVPADSAMSLGGDARVIVDWGGLADTVAVTDSGRFASILREPVGDSVSVTVTAGDDFHPARLRLAREALGEGMVVVMIPRRWVIRSGTYAGDTVDVSPSAAIATHDNFGRIASAGAAPLRGVVGWPRERMPIPVSIHRTAAGRVDEADSVALWRTIRALEDALGTTLFRPAEDSVVERQGWGIAVHVDPTISGSGLTFDTWGNGGLLFDASVAVRHAADFGNPAILHHELLHALGFGHTSAWPSIMRSHVNTATASVTREDVAYAQLLLRVGDMQRALGTRFGMVAAAEGERWQASAPGYRLSTSRRSSVQPSTW